VDAEGETCATVESMQLHVDLATRKTCPPGDAVAECLGAWAVAHAALPRPAQAGRGIGAPR
jgi:carnitine 3-dehydrogenase